ncbi:Pc13g15150 [Penicillium rubens Wisconsin 54-1255]|uniref:Pc13g15150 protein n=1 Tax=Penicillium rubens (strain ATCC 28089 / DSM 1075 / NRRL 1951 / Wisconsin 54-1255) TaxID=500485 RepID=B6H2Q9_PENRW|nr:Pc13g15150 [Penicillium rubens Wisconsin 54-1255]
MAMDNVDPAGRGFLGDLAPSVLPVYQYRDREQLLNTISRITNEKSPLWIKPMGLDRSLGPTGSATHHAAIGAKEADQAWQPFRLPRPINDWPSVVLEVAFPETRDKLQSDITYWLRASGGDVKMGDNSVNHRYQTVQISRKGSEITITGSPLVIEFEKLFLRPPLIEPRERNIQIGDGELQFVAEKAWDLQGM